MKSKPKILQVPHLPIDFGQIEKSFQYCVEYVCDYGYGDEHGHEDICRCQTIERVKIESVSVDGVAEKLVNSKFKFDKVLKPYFLYAVNRIVTYSGALDPAVWDPTVCWGYYGQEVDSVQIASREVKNKLEADLRQLAKDLTPKNCVLTALKAEHGYLIDGISAIADWSIMSISPQSIKLPAAHSFIKLNHKMVKAYENTELPIAVVTLDDVDRYRLIDGRHRYLANKDKKKIKVICGS